MNLFGESTEDQRDKLLGIAGLTAGVQSLRILAERGIASEQDIQVSVEGLRSILDMLPEGSLNAEQLDRLDVTFDQIAAVARVRFKEPS